MDSIIIINDWDEHFENSRTRGMVEMRWVPIPNKMDGDGYTELWEDGDAPSIFAAWVLLLQVGSKCSRRGTLSRANGKPHDAKSLARMTRAPEEIFKKAIPVLVRIGWVSLQAVDAEGSDTCPSGGCQEGDRRVSGSLQASDYGIEWNRIEGKGTEEKEKPAPRKVKRFVKPTPEEVTTYAASIGFQLDGGQFVDFYAANGWKVGRNPMKDWKAAVRTWKRRDLPARKREAII